jgi:peptidoglycan/xylan/chitin deacetylase (PgdA/CDA1 family)
VLDVNKIHFVLAAAPAKEKLVQFILDAIDQYQSQYDLAPSQEYWKQFASPSRYDGADVMFCKRLLQRELPLPLRTKVTDQLFRRHVTQDEVAFACELYATSDQLATMHRCGMYIGSHGYSHAWLNRLSPAEQENEIDSSLNFLRSLGADSERWMMCYPYGGYDESLLRILKSRRCLVGLTTQIGLADLGEHHPLTLPRLDTNDLPKDAAAPPCDWTLKVAG